MACACKSGEKYLVTKKDQSTVTVSTRVERDALVRRGATYKTIRS
jgi:hypothetical protein